MKRTDNFSKKNHQIWMVEDGDTFDSVIHFLIVGHRDLPSQAEVQLVWNGKAFGFFLPGERRAFAEGLIHGRDLHPANDISVGDLLKKIAAITDEVADIKSRLSTSPDA